MPLRALAPWAQRPQLGGDFRLPKTVPSANSAAGHQFCSGLGLAPAVFDSSSRPKNGRPPCPVEPNLTKDEYTTKFLYRVASQTASPSALWLPGPARVLFGLLCRRIARAGSHHRERLDRPRVYIRARESDKPLLES